MKSKLEAVGLEFANSESRCFKLLAARVREKEEIAALRCQLEGRREDELIIMRETADVAGRLEDEIEHLRSECAALRGYAKDGQQFTRRRKTGGTGDALLSAGRRSEYSNGDSGESKRSSGRHEHRQGSSEPSSPHKGVAEDSRRGAHTSAATTQIQGASSVL